MSTSADDVEARFQRPSWPADVAACLDAATTPAAAVRLLKLLVAFNAPFAAGVATLVSHVHSSGVRNPAGRSDTGPARNAVIAAHVFAALEDEFRYEPDGRPLPHAALAAELLEHFAEALGFGTAETVLSRDEQTLVRQTTVAVLEGYGAGRVVEGEALLRCLGYHIGSERAAADEFRLVDEHLHRHFPEQVAALESRPGQYGIPSYSWITLHAALEHEHFEHALTAAQMTVEDLQGLHPRETLQSVVHEGLDAFLATQGAFFRAACRLVSAE